MLSLDRIPDWGHLKTDSVQNSNSVHSVKTENLNKQATSCLVNKTFLSSFSFLFDAQLLHSVKTVVYVVSWQVTNLFSKDVAAKIHTGYCSYFSPAYYEFYHPF